MIIEHRKPEKPTKRYLVERDVGLVRTDWQKWAYYDNLERAKRVARRCEWFGTLARVIDTKN